MSENGNQTVERDYRRETGGYQGRAREKQYEKDDDPMSDDERGYEVVDMLCRERVIFAVVESRVAMPVGFKSPLKFYSNPH